MNGTSGNPAESGQGHYRASLSAFVGLENHLQSFDMTPMSTFFQNLGDRTWGAGGLANTGGVGNPALLTAGHAHASFSESHSPLGSTGGFSMDDFSSHFGQDGSLPASVTLSPQFKTRVNQILAQVGLNEQMLKTKPVKELNNVLRNCPYLGKNEIKLVKARRRTLKNRGYAYNCRIKRNCEQRKRQSRLQIIEGENAELRSRLMDLEEKLTNQKCRKCCPT